MRSRGEKPLESYYVGVDANKMLLNHCFSQDRRSYYHWTSPYGKKKWIWWFTDIERVKEFQQVDKSSHKHLGYNRVGIVIDEIWEVTMINENVHDAIITVYHP